ncbi:unnamed protein product [Trichobilharzia szidati]|nr:unnamed protein product [Trichobilharzia szidati]CAH8850388.1 unnamed protein product [Trichobilharzia szidati]
MYIPLQFSPIMLNDQLKQNCEKYWTLKDSNNNYSASAENQYDQRLVSFIASKGYQCLRQVQNQSSENDSREEQFEMNDKSIDTTVTETNCNTTHTTTTITTTANNNTNTNAPVETTDIVNSNITSKNTPAYHTRSLKCKKSDKSLQIMNEICVLPDHLIDTTHNGHCTLNNNRHCLSDNSRRSNNLKNSKSCEYICIPHINHSSSPPVSSNRKNRDNTSPRLDANVAIFTNPNDTHKDPWNSLLQTNKATRSLFDSPTTSTVTTSQQTAQMLNSNNTPTTSKPSDYYTKLQQISNNNNTSNLQEKIKSNAKHLNSSMIYFNNSKNTEDCYSHYQAPPPVSSCIQSTEEGKNQSNQSITPINLIDLMNDKCGVNYTTTVCKCGGTIKDKTPNTSNNNNSNDSNTTDNITNNSNHDNNGSVIHMISNHRHHHLHHNPHQRNAQHQHQYDNSTIPTDFV